MIYFILLLNYLILTYLLLMTICNGPDDGRKTEISQPCKSVIRCNES